MLGNDPMTESDYIQTITQWREEMQTNLLRENGWLDLVGLHWLEKPLQSFGCHASNDIALPEGSGPENIGTIIQEGELFFADLLPDAGAKVDGEPATGKIHLEADVTGEPSTLEAGNLTLMLIQRGDRHAIRVWDSSSPARKSFTGREWYPIQEDYRVTASLTRYPEPKTFYIPDITGTPSETEFTGQAAFNLHGEEVVADMIELSSGALYLIFRDASSGKTTYPAARYLVTEMPEENSVVIDFNKAYNPPCAFTDYATCPLPAPQNILSVLIEAGEKYSAHSHD